MDAVTVETARIAPNVPTPPPSVTKPRARSKRLGRWVWLVVLAIVGGGLYFSRGAFAALLPQRGSTEVYQTLKVDRGLLRVTVVEDGNVESASNEDIKCQVEGGSQILWIIPEGTQVKKGTELVKLDSSAIEEKITEQTILHEKARSALIKAEEDVAVATIGVKEYVEGTYQKELQTADSNIVIAKENLKSSQNTLEHSERMFRKGYINHLQLEANRFAVQRSQLELDSMQTARKVLVDFTRAKTVKELESKRQAAEAELRAQRAAADLEKTKLDRLQEQLKRCVIVASQDGMVIYANDKGGRWGSQGPVIEEGAQVREFQTIIRLPDLNQMQVKALVHESKVEQIKPGMPARIKILDRELTGSVVTISSQPEPSSFFSAAVKEYAAIIRIDSMGEDSNLKPGMTAEAEIIIAELLDVVAIPLTGIVEVDNEIHCYVKKPGGYETRRVVLGLANDKYLEVKDGLNPGDEIILNPRSTIPEAKAVAQAKSLSRLSNVDVAAVKKRNGAKAEKSVATPSSPGSAPKIEGAPSSSGLATAGASSTAPSPGSEQKASKKSFNLMSFDKNKDGKISLDEAPDRMKPMFSMMDTNKDGSIDSKEANEARKALQNRQRQQGGSEPGAGGTPPGGRLSAPRAEASGAGGASGGDGRATVRANNP